MHTASLDFGRLLRNLSIALMLASIQRAGIGQLNSRNVSITLVARLESLSVSAVLPADGGFPAPGHNGPIPISITTSWAVPSNRTMVKVVENGKTVFSQAAGDSNRPKRRTDQLNIAVPCDRSEAANSETQHHRVIIFVQAL